MSLNKSFQLANKYFWLILVPIVFDLLQIEDILRRAQGFTFKLTIPAALPSITQILGNPNQGTGGFNFNLPYDYLGPIAVLIFIFMILAGAFLKGGFLGCVLAGVKEQEVSVGVFFQMAKKYFVPFIMQTVLLYTVLIVLVPFLFLLGPLALLFVIGIMVLFFYLIFWDYIIVVENENLLDAARTSFRLVQSNLGKVLSFVIPIAIITGLFGILVSAVMAFSYIGAIIAIVVYAYFGTIVIFSMMMFYLEAIRNSSNGFELGN